MIGAYIDPETVNGDHDTHDHIACCEARPTDGQTATLCGKIITANNIAQICNDPSELETDECPDCLEMAGWFHCPYYGSCAH